MSTTVGLGSCQRLWSVILHTLGGPVDPGTALNESLMVRFW